jgi:predicted phosphodiesterase
VIHVTGNRDFLMRKANQLVLYLTINGVKFGITHGHGGFLPYFLDKLPYMIEGYKFERYQKKLDKMVRDVNVVIFGHTHTSENRWVNGRLYFNSGSAYDRGKDRQGPSVGLITVNPQGKVESSIIALEFMHWSNGKWKKQTNSSIKRFKS